MPQYTTDAARDARSAAMQKQLRTYVCIQKRSNARKEKWHATQVVFNWTAMKFKRLHSPVHLVSKVSSLHLIWQRRQQLGTCSGSVVNNRMSLGVSQCRVSRDTAGITFERLKERMHTATGAYNPSVRVIRHQGETRKQCGGTSSAATSQGRATASAFAQIGPQRVH